MEVCLVVSVEHLKREKSFDETPAQYFEFEWSLKLTFDRDLRVLRVCYFFLFSLLSIALNPLSLVPFDPLQMREIFTST